MDVDSFEEMFPPATWADFEGTVYARGGNEPVEGPTPMQGQAGAGMEMRSGRRAAARHHDSDDGSTSESETDEEAEREKADAADRGIAGQGQHKQLENREQQPADVGDNNDSDSGPDSEDDDEPAAEEIEAAVKIQRMTRGWLCRRRTSWRNKFCCER